MILRLATTPTALSTPEQVRARVTALHSLIAAKQATGQLPNPVLVKKEPT